MRVADSTMLATMYGLVEKFGFVRFLLGTINVMQWWIDKSQETPIHAYQANVDYPRTQLRELVFRLQEIAKMLQAVKP